ncbi:MAG: DUF485 domain-containing protein [Planctomycetota bacterium]
MEDSPESPPGQYAARIGLVLFAVYSAFYAGFVVLGAVAPGAMEATPVAGLNVAVLYGFGLIVAAFVLAVVYGWLAGHAGERDEQGGPAG